MTRARKRAGWSNEQPLSPEEVKAEWRRVGLPDLGDECFSTLATAFTDLWFGNREWQRSADYQRLKDAFDLLVQHTRSSAWYEKEDFPGSRFVEQEIHELHLALKKARLALLGPTRLPRAFPPWGVAAIRVWCIIAGILTDIGERPGTTENSKAIRLISSILRRSGYGGATPRRIGDWLRAQGARTWLGNGPPGTPN
jgi:hypothetical protein